MKKNVLNFRHKARRLMKLYSLWQETRDCRLEKKCLNLLSELLWLEPRFSLQQEFRKAF